MANARKQSEPKSEVLDTLNETQEEVLQNLERSSAAVLDGMSKWGSEVSRFISERLREDVRIQTECLCCKDINELRDVQTRFFKRAARQYADEANRLMKMSTEIVSQSMTKG